MLARVGNLRITESEFQRKLAEVSAGYQDYVLTPSGRRQFLDVLIREKLILAVARHSDVPNSSAFRGRFAQLKSDEEQRVREGGEQLLTTLWIENLRARGELKVPDSEVREYLAKNPTEVEIRHVLLATAAQAELVAKKLRGGANFATIARDESLDFATAARGGKFPALMRGEVFPELEEVVFKMRVGEIAGPLKSKFGYHVIKKESERHLADSTQTKERVRRLLEKQKLDAYLQRAQEKFPVEVVDEQFK